MVQGQRTGVIERERGTDFYLTAANACSQNRRRQQEGMGQADGMRLMIDINGATLQIISFVYDHLILNLFSANEDRVRVDVFPSPLT